MRRVQVLLLFPLVVCSVLLCLFVPGTHSSRNVTLKSIQLFTTHTYFLFKRSIFFQCKGEKLIPLPDVMAENSLYTFNGEESWQPLTELPAEKCKRCGVYERDPVQTSPFDEWELCPLNFIDQEYIHFKENEFNATFSCLDCGLPANFTRSFEDNDSNSSSAKTYRITRILIGIMVPVILIFGLVVGYFYWQKRKRDIERAQFLKMFNETDGEIDDDIEDELGIGRII